MSESGSFGAWLRWLRKEQGIGQVALAARIGCATITLQKIEGRERRPSRAMALLLADYLAIPAVERENFIAFARNDAHAVQPDSRAPWRAAHRTPNNLPTPLTTLIGRASQEAALREILAQTAQRLLTISGPPGVGKTRLALAVASGLLGSFADGVYLVDLTALNDPALVLAALATTLGVRESADERLADSLRRHFANKQLLLLLDNFEQVLAAAPALVEVLQASAGLKALVTSREPLQVRGERVYPLPPLDLPAAAATALPQALASNPAVALFVERAISAQPDFTLDAANAAAVVAICVTLDGLPLAIELAAANSGILAPAEIAARLNDRFAMLGGGLRDLPARQRTLQRAIDWSYELLNTVQQRLLARLGVFAAGCTPAALAALNGDADASADELRQHIMALHNKNLLRYERNGTRERIVLLETIREYAFARLGESGERAIVRRRHALHYMRLAEEAQRAWDDPRRDEWLVRLEAERANIGAALAWANEPEDAAAAVSATPGRGEIALRLAIGVTAYWWLLGHIHEARGWLTRALADDATSGVAVDPVQLRRRAEALRDQGWLSNEQSDYSAGRALLEQALALFEALADEIGIADTLTNMASGQMYVGNLDAAQQLLQRGLALRRKLGDSRAIAQSLGELGNVVLYRGDYDLARRLYEEVLALYRAWSDKNHVATVAANLATVLIFQGEYAPARALLDESLALAEAAGDKSNAAYALCALGLAADRAGDPPIARQHYAASLLLAVELGDKRLAAECIEGVARAFSGMGRLIAAAHLFAAAAALRSAINAAEAAIDVAANDLARGATQRQLAAAHWQAAWSAGLKMTPEQAAVYIAGWPQSAAGD